MSKTALAALKGAAFVFFLDRVTKETAEKLPAFGDHPYANLLTLTHHQNYGIIANVPVPQLVILVGTVLILAFVLHALKESICAGRARTAIALGVLIGGAAGNLYDRMMQGFVFDWILLFGRSVINLADIAIVVGAIWYFAEMRRSESTVDSVPN